MLVASTIGWKIGDAQIMDQWVIEKKKKKKKKGVFLILKKMHNMKNLM